MESTKVKKNVYQTILSENDRTLLRTFIKCCGPFVELERIGKYATMACDEIWMSLVIQVCVSGSARNVERLERNKDQFAKFKKAVSHPFVLARTDRCAYIAERFQEFAVTRFHQRSAERLVKMLSCPSVFHDDRFSLLDGLTHEEAFTNVRDTLIERCPIFGLKSASDFMIVVGLSDDVIALDTRVVGIFHRYCGYNFKASQVQSKRSLYYSLEEALRVFCGQEGISLAHLDRLLFNFGGMSVLELAFKRPNLFT